MKPQPQPPIEHRADSSFALRVLVLGTLYAMAVFVAVAFSPNMGFVSHPAEPAGRIAALK